MTIRVGILGAGGRMGRMLTQVVRERTDHFDLVGLVSILPPPPRDRARFYQRFGRGVPGS